MSHSPLPWRVERLDRARFADFMVHDAADSELLVLYTNDGADDPKWLPAEANAEYIVRAANAYPALVEALKDALAQITKMNEFSLRLHNTAWDVPESINAALKLADGDPS